MAVLVLIHPEFQSQKQQSRQSEQHREQPREMQARPEDNECLHDRIIELLGVAVLRPSEMNLKRTRSIVRRNSKGTDGGANLRPDQGIVSMRRVLRLDVECAKFGLLLPLRLLLGLRECHLRHTWGYGWTAPHA